MRDFLLFLGKFFKHGTAIASLAPSSPWLSRATVGNVDWDAARAEAARHHVRAEHDISVAAHRLNAVFDAVSRGSRA